MFSTPFVYLHQRLRCGVIGLTFKYSSVSSQIIYRSSYQLPVNKLLCCRCRLAPVDNDALDLLDVVHPERFCARFAGRQFRQLAGLIHGLLIRAAPICWHFLFFRLDSGFVYGSRIGIQNLMKTIHFGITLFSFLHRLLLLFCSPYNTFT